MWPEIINSYNPIILDKLKNKFHIDGALLKFLANYLQNRKQQVLIGGTKSSLKEVKSGVPQGSILGPLLFVFFINDMSEVVSTDTHIVLYADDAKIWRNICCWNDLCWNQRKSIWIFKSLTRWEKNMHLFWWF